MHRRVFFASLATALLRNWPARAAAQVRPARWDDFPAPLQSRLRVLGVSDWDTWSTRLRADTARRIDEGRFDHLIAVALQSGRFTAQPPIEPALSARAFHEAGRIPQDAARRLDALAEALARGDDRLGVIARLPPAPGTASQFGTLLRTHYARVMQFLLAKEFVARSAEEVARLYETRGLSTDTGIDAAYAVADSIGAMPLDGPAHRVLIVGPGVDLGPRTGLDDASLGQSLQPLAVLEALRVTGRAGADLRIDAIDVNPLVVDVLTQASVAPTPPSLVLLSSLSARTHRLLPPYRTWLERWGRALGAAPSPLRSRPDGRLARGVTPAREAWSRVSASLGHAAIDVTLGAYDLVVATNVLAYLGDAALIAAAGTLSRALRPGGVLIHNDTRDLMAHAAADAGLPLVQARSVAFSSPDANGHVAHDWACIHRLTA